MRTRLALLVAPLLLVALLPGAVSAGGPSRPGPEPGGGSRLLDPGADGRRPAARHDAGHRADGQARRWRRWHVSAPRGRRSCRPVTRATGKVYFEMGGGAWICSGAVATDSRTGYSLVAAPPAIAPSTRTPATSPAHWMFIPAFDLNPTYTAQTRRSAAGPRRRCRPDRSSRLPAGSTTTAVQHDWAFAVVAGGGKEASSNSQLDATVGGSFALDATAGAGPR